MVKNGISFLENLNNLEAKTIIFEYLLDFYKIPSESDKVACLCDCISRICKAKDTFIVEVEEKNNLRFCKQKVYHRFHSFLYNWRGELKQNRIVAIYRDNIKYMSDFLFLKKNELDNLVGIPLFYQFELVGIVAIENIREKYQNCEESLFLLGKMISEQVTKILDGEAHFLPLNYIYNEEESTIKFINDDLLTLIEADEEFYKIIEMTKEEFIHFYNNSIEKIFTNIRIVDSDNYIEKIKINNIIKHIYVKKEIDKSNREKEVILATLKDISNSKSLSEAIMAKMRISNNGFYNSVIGYIIIKNNDKLEIVYTDKTSRDILQVTKNTDIANYLYKDDYNIFHKVILESHHNVAECTLRLKDKQKKIYTTICCLEIGKIYLLAISSVIINKGIYQDTTPYKNMPGFLAKFMVTDKLRLLEATNGFFQFLGLDYEKCNNFVFPPVFKKDVRLVNGNILKMKTAKPLSFDFRAKNKDGKICWLRLEANCIGVIDVYPVYLALFIDITKQRQLELDLEEKRAKYNLLEFESTDTFFEYDLVNDIFYGPAYFSFLNHESETTCVEGYLEKLRKTITMPTIYIKKWMHLLNGEYQDPFELKISFIKDDKIIEVAKIIESSFVYDGQIPIKIIGKIIDKENSYQEAEKQLEKSKYDALTGLFSRDYAEDQIRKYLETNNNQSFLLVIDIDEFKKINETYGYMFGNIILNEFGDLLKKTFPINSLIYRLIDDDFVVFLKDNTIEMAKIYADKICESIKLIYIGDDEDIKLSCSVGIASLKYESDLAPALRQASEMVFQIKNCGKGFSAYYHQEDMQEYNFSCIPNPYLNNENDILLFAYEILEKAKNIKSAINILLSRVGKQYSLNCIAVVSSILNERNFDVKYWWEVNNSCKEVLELINTHKQIIFNTLSDSNYLVEMNFAKNHKMLVSKSNENNNEHFIILDSSVEHLWTKEERELLFELTKIILTHIKKAKAYSISEDKSKFLSKMSHEIRTPLNTIIGMASLTKELQKDDAKIYEYFNTIDASAKYLLNLINNLLEVSRLDSGKIELALDPFNIEDFLADLNNIMKVQASEKKIVFNVLTKLSRTNFFGDATRLNQILINLIGNAIKFTPEKGKVELIVKEEKVEDNYIYLRFAVRDTGIGIKKERIKKIFDPFVQEDATTTKKYGGSGLGLSISNRLVNMMGGEISVISEEQQGSEFYFTIPLKLNQKYVQNENKRLIKKLIGKNILVAEDNELSASIVSNILEKAGACVEVVNDGTKVVDAFNSKCANYYDVILMDVMMPLLNGIEATRAIRNLERKDANDIIIIAMTANAFDDDIKDCLAAGMNGHLAKPFDVEKLCCELNKISQN